MNLAKCSAGLAAALFFSFSRVEAQPLSNDERVSQATAVVQRYLSTPSRLDRLQFVMDAQNMKPLMERYYGGFSGQIPTNAFELPTSPKPEVHRGGWVTVHVIINRDVVPFYVRETADGCKIDWIRSIGFNETSPEGFRAAKPTGPVRFFAVAKLDDYYNFEFRRQETSAWSISMSDSHGSRIGHGYVDKSSRMGESLFEILKDGQNHRVVVEVACLPAADDGSVFRIVKVHALNSWLEPALLDVPTPAEIAALQARHEAEQRRAMADATLRNSETDQRLLKFQIQKAADGYGSAQYELGLRYLNGKGVESNAVLARRWLEAAATNAYPGASNQLHRLGSPLQ